MRASFIKIRIDNSDRTFCEVEQIMPSHIAHFCGCKVNITEKYPTQKFECIILTIEET